MNYNYIIVGQGIAGTVLAHTLLNRGKTVVIIDEQNLSQSSRIAAGLYNPVVFKRLVKSWMADELIPYMDKFYSEVEKLLEINFYFKKEIVKLFANENEKIFWSKKTNEDVGKYLNKFIDNAFLKDLVYSPCGAANVVNAGNIDTVMFLKASRNYFLKNNFFLTEIFEYNKLVISENSVKYKSLTADKIIFCEGFRAIDNPYFSWLSFKLTKGEVITIKTKVPLGNTKLVINKGAFIVPFENNIYKVGATYEWDDLTEHTTEKGKSDLIEKLTKIVKIPFEIIDHQAGIRPTVKDRRPLLGLHPEHNTLAVFNGMGTKGVMLAPYFAGHFADFLENKIPLMNEVNSNRFKN